MRRRLKCRNERNPCPVLHFTGDCLATSGEEGGDDVKSARRLRPGQHTSYNGEEQRAAKPQGRANPKILPQFRLFSEIREHEVGLGSNRGSADRGEYVLISCTRRPSHEESRQRPKSPFWVLRRGR